MVKLTCQVCGAIYHRSPSAAKNSKHCSRTCHNKVAGKASSKPWAHKISKSHTGMKKPWNSERNKKYKTIGAQHTNWKNDEVGYIALHNWAYRHVGLKNFCELCSSKKNLEMANISQQYKRDVLDWRTLCRKCHRAHDAEFRRNGGVSRKLPRWKKKNPA